jgi:hypothetical protein
VNLLAGLGLQLLSKGVLSRKFAKQYASNMASSHKGLNSQQSRCWKLRSQPNLCYYNSKFQDHLYCITLITELSLMFILMLSFLSCCHRVSTQLRLNIYIIYHIITIRAFTLTPNSRSFTKSVNGLPYKFIALFPVWYTLKEF